MMFSRGRVATRDTVDDVVPFVDVADTVMLANAGQRQDNAHAPQQESAKNGLQIHSREGTSWMETEPQPAGQRNCVHDLSDTTSDDAVQLKRQEAWGRFPDMDVSGQVNDGLGKKNTTLLDLQEEDLADNNGIFVPSAQKWFSSISDAVHHCSEGEVIKLKPGMYHESEQVFLQIPGVRIEAEEMSSGNKVEIVFEYEAKVPSIVCHAEGIVLVGLHVLRKGVVDKADVGDSNKACVVIDMGNVSIQSCTVRCQTGTGIFVTGEATPTITGCTLSENCNAAICCSGKSMTVCTDCSIKRNVGFGVWLLDTADGKFSKNKIGRNSKCGVLCCGKCTGIFDSNKVSSGGQGGFWTQGESTVIITNNIIKKNHRAAMQVSDDADPIVASNTILEGEGGGIVVHDRAKGFFYHNNLSSSCRAGAGVMDSASPLFLCNIMSNNNGGGAVVAGQSTPSFIGNEFFSNGFVGVGMKEKSRVTLQSNVIVDTCGYGLLMQDSSFLQMHDTRIERNEQSGVCVCDQSSIWAYACHITAGEDKEVQKCGITLHGNSKMHAEDCVVSGNLAGNILLNDNASCTMIRSTVTSSKSSGVTLQGSSNATLIRNIISNNKICNLLVLDNSTVTAEWNVFSEAVGYGVRIMGSPSCKLIHNSIMWNSETGLVASGGSVLAMNLNRISHNGKDGLYLDGTTNSVVWNTAIFENGSVGLRLKNVTNLSAMGNLLLAAIDKQNASCSSSLVLRGSIGGTLSHNVIHSRHGAVVAGEAHQQIMGVNHPCVTDAHGKEAIAMAMASFAYYETKREQLKSVIMPDGTLGLAIPFKLAQAPEMVASQPSDSTPTSEAPPTSEARKLAFIKSLAMSLPQHAYSFASARRASVPDGLVTAHSTMEAGEGLTIPGQRRRLSETSVSSSMGSISTVAIRQVRTSGVAARRFSSFGEEVEAVLALGLIPRRDSRMENAMAVSGVLPNRRLSQEPVSM